MSSDTVGPVMPTRKYEQGLRAEAAEETRKRILDALYARLSEQPSEPVSVEQVARLARVARSTIYLVFGSRAGLFDALAAELFRTGEFARVEAAAANPDAREHLRGGIRGATEMMAAHRTSSACCIRWHSWTSTPSAVRCTAWRMRGPGEWPAWPSGSGTRASCATA